MTYHQLSSTVLLFIVGVTYYYVKGFLIREASVDRLILIRGEREYKKNIDVKFSHHPPPHSSSCILISRDYSGTLNTPTVLLSTTPKAQVPG